MTTQIKQHLISGDLSRAFQLTNTNDNYTMIKEVLFFTIAANRPNIAVDAPTAVSLYAHKELNTFPPILILLITFIFVTLQQYIEMQPSKVP